MKITKFRLLIIVFILFISVFFIYRETFSDKTQASAKRVPILLYHHLLTEEENTFGNNSAILSVDKFKKQMEFLYDNGYTTITLDELEGFLRGQIDLPKKSILITFDDGYKSNYIYAHPILKEYGFKAAIFLVSSWNTEETVPFDPDEIQYLSWQEIGDGRDVFEYASHTHALHVLDDNKKGYLVTKPLEEVKEDLKTAMDLLDTGSLAYPYGHYNSEILETLDSLGYTMAFTVKSGKVKPGDSLLELRRQSIFAKTSLRRFKRMVK